MLMASQLRPQKLELEKDLLANPPQESQSDCIVHTFNYIWTGNVFIKA